MDSRSGAKPSQHYLTLDALRGVAAFAVVIYHQQHAAWMGHGYLAVDFFFILSGFVIANAYEHKLGTNMSFGRFVLVRLARLYPLLMAATLLAAGFAVVTAARSDGDYRMLRLVPAALFALPDVTCLYAPDPFPVLPVVWSLFFELVANFVYALLAPRIDRRGLILIILLNAILLVWATAWHGNGELGSTYGTLPAGIPRVICSFFAGVLIYRLRASLPAARIRTGVLVVILLAALSVERGTPWLYDSACVLIVFPLIVMAGVMNEPRVPRLAKLSADLSYPLYLFHLPLLHWLALLLGPLAIAQRTEQLAALIIVPTLAYIAHLVDQPLQRLLKARVALRIEPVPIAP